MTPELDPVEAGPSVTSASRLGHRGALVFLYCLSFWPLLVNNGVFWDDWVLYDQKPQTLTLLFSELGTSPVGRSMSRVLLLLPPVAGRWFVFAIYLIAMLVTYRILVKTRLFEPNTAFILTLLATLVPFNFARVTMACAAYAVYYLLFLLAFLALLKYIETGRPVLRLASLLLFFVSFSTNSLLVFYLLPLLYLAYTERSSLSSLDGAAKRIGSYLDFVVLPVVFYALKSAFLIPHGIYADYHAPSSGNITRSSFEVVPGVWSSLAGVAGKSLAIASTWPLLLLVTTVAVYWLVGRSISEHHGGVGARASSSKRFLLGVLAFYVGILPYLAIGRKGETFGAAWESRDQLLLGIGVALMLFYGLRYLFSVVHAGLRVQRAVLSVVVASFVLVNVVAYLDFQKDWYKQLAFMENVEGISSVRDNTTFEVRDRAAGLNAMDRHVEFYEYTGALKRVFGTTTRLALPASNISWLDSPEFIADFVARPQYNFEDWAPAGPTQTIVIDPGRLKLGLGAVGRLLAEEFLNSKAFRTHVKQVLVVRVGPQ